MLRSQLVAALAVVLTSVLSGSLECSQHDDTRVQYGAQLYARTCAVCHGAKGEGYRADDAPAITHPDFLATVTDEHLRAAIKNGRSGTTMSAWAKESGGPLSPGDINALIAYLRAQQKTPRAKLDERPTSGDAMRGQAVYTKQCNGCHGFRGVGGPNVHIGDPELLGTASDGFLRYAIRKGRAGTPMPAFDLILGDDAIEDVTTYVRSLQRSQSPATARQPPRQAPIPLGPVPLNPNGPDPVGFKPQPATTPVDVVHAQLEHGARMAILDARAPSDYMNEHIAGAVSVPFYDPTPYFADLPHDTWLVAYCACPHAESGQLATKLSAAGFKRVTVLDEGLGVWRSRKYGTHSGDKP